MPEIKDFDNLLETTRKTGGFALLDTSITEGALHSIRAEFDTSSDPFDRHRAICAQIGAADHLDLRRMLMQLRETFETRMLSAAIGEVYQAFARSPEDGWNAWLTKLAAALSAFHLRHSLRLCIDPFPFEPSHKQTLVEIGRAVEYIRQGRWEEAYEGLDFLSKQECVPARSRARLVALLAQIELFRFSEPEKARQRLDEAKRLTPNDGMVLASFGYYWMDKKDTPQATEYYERAITSAPKEANGYVGMGERFEKDETLDEAERIEKATWWYREAVFKAGGDSMGYGRLLGLLGRPATLASREEEFRAVLQTKLAVSPESEYDTYLNVGQCLSKDFPKAREWYEKAIRLEEHWPLAYTSLAELWRSQGDEGAGEEIGKKAIEVAPDYPSAYIFLARLYEAQSRWRGALALYKTFPQLPRQWVSFARASVGRMHEKLGDYEEAERTLCEGLREELRSDVEQRYAQAALEELAEGHYKARGNKGAAIRIYDEILHIQDKPDIGSYHNLLGNMHYNLGDYASAVDEYRQSIELAPSEVVYYTNLARALERKKETGQRQNELKEAILCYESAEKITKQAYTERIKRLRLRISVAQECGEKTLDWLNAVPPIVVEVAADLIRHLFDIPKPSKPTLSEELSSNVKLMRERLLKQLGVNIPGILFRDNNYISNGTYIVMIKEIPIVSGNVSPERRFCTVSEEILARLEVKGDSASDPTSGQGGVWINRKDWKTVEAQELELWEFTQYLMRHVEAVVRKNLVEFLGHQEIVNLLESESARPIDEIRASSRLVTALTTVCKALVAEEVPIQPFYELCAAFKDLYANNVGLREIVERIRGLPAFRDRLPGNEGRNSFMKFSSRFEEEIRRSLYEEDGHMMLAVEPERCQKALTAIRNHVSGRSLALVVDDAVLRPFVRKLVELEFPNLPVLSRAELRNDGEIETAALLDLDGEPSAERIGFSSPRLFNAMAADTEQGLERATLALSDMRIEVFIGKDFQAQASAADGQPLEEMLSKMQEGLFNELGIILPEMKLRPDQCLSLGEFRICLNGVEYQPHQPVDELGQDEFLVNDTVDRLNLLGVQARDAVNPVNGIKCAIVRETQGQVETCRQAGLTTWGIRGFLVLSLSSAIRSAAAQFQTDDVTEYKLDSMGEACTSLVRIALERYTLPQISLVLRKLLEEDISIRDLGSILESLLSINGKTDVDLSRFIVFFAHTDGLCPVPAVQNTSGLTARQLADFVRATLRRYISHKYKRGGNTLVVYLLDPAIEKRLADIGARPLTEQEDEKLRAAIRGEVGNLPPTATFPVLLTTFEIRHALRKIVQREFPRLAVLSYQELSPDMNIQPIARISC